MYCFYVWAEFSGKIFTRKFQENLRVNFVTFPPKFPSSNFDFGNEIEGPGPRARARIVHLTEKGHESRLRRSQPGTTWSDQERQSWEIDAINLLKRTAARLLLDCFWVAAGFLKNKRSICCSFQNHFLFWRSHWLDMWISKHKKIENYVTGEGRLR